MKITTYFRQIKQTIEKEPLIASFEITEDTRTEFEGFIKARIIFIDNSKLDFREYLNTSGKTIEKYAYSFHYQKSKKLIFRYDNTPHHPSIRTFPHHKHLSTEKIVESPEVELKMVLNEITNYLITNL